LIKKVGTFFDGKDFSPDELNESYVKLIINTSKCDYDPYTKEEYYDREQEVGADEAHGQ